MTDLPKHGFRNILIAVAALSFCAGYVSLADDAVQPVRGYTVEVFVPGGPLKGVNGLAFGPDGRLYAGSVYGQTIYEIDVDSGNVEEVVGAPAGEADDLAFGPDGSLAWTALTAGELRLRLLRSA